MNVALDPSGLPCAILETILFPPGRGQSLLDLATIPALNKLKIANLYAIFMLRGMGGPMGTKSLISLIEMLLIP